jgi:hypothetical protein
MYRSREEAESATVAEDSRELHLISYDLGCIFEEKRLLYTMIEMTEDDDDLAELRWKLKAQKDLEQSLQRRASICQSLLKIP